MSLACAMLLASLAEMDRTRGLPDFLRQLCRNTAQESREVQTARAVIPVPRLAGGDSVIPLSSIILNLRRVEGAYFYS